MNGLKKWMVVLMTGVTLMGNVIGMGTTVIASKNETQESLSGVDVYMPENGSLERVTVKETIGVGVNEKAALSSDKNCPFVYINFDFTLVNKVASL